MRKTDDKTRPASRGFTLVEMLTVLFILGILMALVVGVAMYVRHQATRKETAGIQATVMLAIQTYYDELDDYPADSVDDPLTLNQNEAGVSLLEAMKSNDAAAALAILRDLPAEALTGGDTAIRDGYGRPMGYEKAGGMGGNPVLISAGQDGDFDTLDDNIRSDQN